jgi:tRNA-2-methylthio-N6-dimethylallyladenosine synthase
LPLEEVGFDYPALRNDVTHSWVPISNGCNNFCTFCVVPFTRGREISRPFQDIVSEIKTLAKQGCREVTLLGQNVNSYGADLVKNNKGYKLPDGRIVKPIMVKHLGRFRIPTLFPYLLEEVCKIKGVETIKFISSNPWDFSDELIEVIAKNPKIDKNLHLAVQSGDDEVLKRMNRWYTAKEYIDLVNKIKSKIKGAQISTDIIVGFPGETEEQFQNTIKLANDANFAT